MSGDFEVKALGAGDGQKDEKRKAEYVKAALEAFASVKNAPSDEEVRRIEAERLRSKREDAFLKSGVAEKYAKVELSDLINSGLADMRAADGRAIGGAQIFHAFIGDVSAERQRALWFYGKCGTGKTVLAVALMRELCRQGVSCAYFKMHEIMQRLDDVKWHLSRETRAEVMREVSRPGLLVLDEIGRWPDPNLEQFVLFDVTNRRYEAYRSSIYVSNLGKKGLGEFMGGAVADRFRGIGASVEFVGKSFRGAEEELYTR